MIEDNINELWRQLFVGERHKAISNQLAHSFNVILRAAEENNLIQKSDYVRARITQANINDISDTSKLIALRFEARFKNKNGFQFQSSLPALLQAYCYSSEVSTTPVSVVEKLKSLVYKGIQLEVICKQLSFSRNLNAHSQDILDDLGHGVLVSGAVLRLWELFEFETNETVFQDIQRLCYSILDRSGSLAPVYRNNKIEVSDDYFDLVDDHGAVDGANRVDEQENLTRNLPVEYFPDSKNQELKRQRLMALRLEILEFMRLNFPDLKRDKCVLSGQIITEILNMNILCTDDLSHSPSISYLLQTNKNAVTAQLHEFGSRIFEIIGKSDEQ